jgi:ribulose-phosphate 3-epimerase
MKEDQIQVIPAVIPPDLETLKSQFSQVVGVVKKVQVDFVDGQYAPPISWPFNAGDNFDEAFPFLGELEMEADLFVREPKEFLQKLLSKGFKNFVIHLDSAEDISECLEIAKKADGEVGVGIKPSGDFGKLERYLERCDFVQFMGNDKVGYNGVGLDPEVLPKISILHAKHPALPLQIDIGVNFDTAGELKAAGISRLVSGSAIFESNMLPADAINKLLEKVKES